MKPNGLTSSRRSAEHGFTPSRRSAEHGFTLVELLVSLLIFGMLSAAGVALLSFSVRSQDLASERLDRIAELRRTNALLTSDFAQAAPRLARDAAGVVQPAFEGGEVVSFVRRGWENTDNAARPSLQKIEYDLVGGALERRAYRFVDGAEPMATVPIIEGVTGLAIRYRDDKGEWRDRWDPLQPTEMPRAVEMVLDTEDGGSIRQLFLVGTAA